MVWLDEENNGKGKQDVKKRYYPNTPLKGACENIGYKRTNPMNKKNYKSFDIR